MSDSGHDALSNAHFIFLIGRTGRKLWSWTFYLNTGRRPYRKTVFYRVIFQTHVSTQAGNDNLGKVTFLESSCNGPSKNVNIGREECVNILRN